MPCLFGTLSRQKLGPRYIEVHLSNEEARPQTARQPDLDVVVKVYPLIVGRCRRGSMYVNATGFSENLMTVGDAWHVCFTGVWNPFLILPRVPHVGSPQELQGLIRVSGSKISYPKKLPGHKTLKG